MSAPVLTTCLDNNKKQGNLTTKSYFDVEDQEKKKNAQSPTLTTAKTKKHSNITLKIMIAEKNPVLNRYANSMCDQVKYEKNVSGVADYIYEKLATFDKITQMYIKKTDILFE